LVQVLKYSTKYISLLACLLVGLLV
jgi:hypothetical protein